MKKILSIIVPAYNVEDYLEKNLNSLLEIKNVDDIEVIVVNDGSEDNTLNIANTFQKRAPKSVIIIDKKNGGHGSAINIGVEIASGKYIRIVDGDDWVDSNQLEIFIEKLKYTDVDLILSPFAKVYINNQNQEIVELEHIRNSKTLNFRSHILEIGDFYCMHSITFKATIYKKSHFQLTENCFYVDIEFILYPISLISKFSYIDCNIYRYRLGRAEQSVSMKSKIKNRDMHLKVINDLLSNCVLSENLDLHKSPVEYYIIRRIISLVNTQYSIYLSMNIGKDIYKMVLDLRKTILNIIPAKFYFGISSILHKFPFLYWALCWRYKIKYRKSTS